LLTRHCSHCLLVKNKGGCSFGLFNYDSFVSFRAIGVIWGIRELTAELVCLLFWHSSLSLPCGGLFLVPTLWGTLPCPYPVGDSALSPTLLWTDNLRHENHLYVDCPGVGQVDNQRHENHLYVDCPGVGQVARGLRTL